MPVPALLLQQCLSEVIIFLIFILFGFLLLPSQQFFFYTVKQPTVTYTTIPSQPNQPFSRYIAVTSDYSVYHYTFSIFGDGNISLAAGFAFPLKSKDLAEKSHTPPRISGYPRGE